jgi:hypothetical protein
MESGEILLRIRRKFSRSEKFKLVLKELEQLQEQLAAERKAHTELLKEKQLLLQQINDLNNKLADREKKLKKFEILQSQNHFISSATHDQACKDRNEYRKKYIAQVEANIDLQHKINKLQQNGNL